MSIECRAWAGNIEYHGGSLKRAGSVTFEVQVDAERYPPQENQQTTEVVLNATTQNTPTPTTVQINPTLTA